MTQLMTYINRLKSCMQAFELWINQRIWLHNTGFLVKKFENWK